METSTMHCPLNYDSSKRITYLLFHHMTIPQFIVIILMLYVKRLSWLDPQWAADELWCWHSHADSSDLEVKGQKSFSVYGAPLAFQVQLFSLIDQINDFFRDPSLAVYWFMTKTQHQYTPKTRVTTNLLEVWGQMTPGLRTCFLWSILSLRKKQSLATFVGLFINTVSNSPVTFQFTRLFSTTYLQ